MSRPAQTADADDDGSSEMAAALRDPNTTRLLQLFGEQAELVVDHAFHLHCCGDARKRLLYNQLSERFQNTRNLWLGPLFRALQSSYADCRCSAFGHLLRRNTVVSGSLAERLINPPRPPDWQTTSDVDMMTEIGPAQWTFPVNEKAHVENIDAGCVGAVSGDPRGQGSDQAPRLVIAETENPGFVLVLQERRDDCPHQERLPFKSEAVRELFKNYHSLTTTNIGQCSTHGPASSFSKTVREGLDISKLDKVACLRVHVWWFSEEFFIRHHRYNWPPEATRENIRRYGLHLVPVGAPGSITEKEEWRLSFSRAEVVCTYHLNDVQRCAVVALKVCKTALGKGGKVISSYFVKTALYWLCEEIPSEDWTSITHGVLKVLDFLDEAVKSGTLKCYFWSSMNLFRFVNRTERKNMKKTLRTIRKHFMRLLTHELCVGALKLRGMLTQDRLSGHQLFTSLTRWLIRAGVYRNMLSHIAVTTADDLNKLLPVLIRSYTPDKVIGLFGNWMHWYEVQITLYQALMLAPADVASRVRLSANDGGGLVCDAAPLLELLTEDDLKFLLGDPDAVRAWLRRQYQLPETERPAGLPADLSSPRDLCDLLINVPLLSWVLRVSLPDVWAWYKSNAAVLARLPTCKPFPIDQAKQQAAGRSDLWPVLAVVLYNQLGVDGQTALEVAHRAGVGYRQLCDAPETVAEHWRIRHVLLDPWQLQPIVFGSSV